MKSKLGFYYGQIHWYKFRDFDCDLSTIWAPLPLLAVTGAPKGAQDID